MKHAPAALLLTLLLATTSHARAHPLGFAVVSIRETTPHEAEVVVRVSGTESDPGRIELAWPEGCRERVVRDTTRDEVRERRIIVSCDAALVGRELRVEGPARGLEVLVLAELADHARTRSVIRSLPADVELGAAESPRALVVAQARLGALHFALGIDHVLFVLAAFFLARKRGARAVAVAVTAFTIGHAITLALVTLERWTIPTRPVEACIALSLVHVARELRVERDTITRRTPAIACGLFGLVHGAGLASAMSNAGLRGATLAMAVGSFNVGLEVAELALVLLLFAAIRGRVVRGAEALAPFLVGGVGAWLLLDRLV